MKLDYDQLRFNVQQYLASPASERVWKEFENSVLFNVVGSFILFIIAAVLVCTIVFARIGFDMMRGLFKSFITLEVFRNQRKKLQGEPDRIIPLVAAGIILGRQGHGLVLGSFSPKSKCDLALIGRKSTELSKLYTDGSKLDFDQPMLSILRDDTYIHNRRRAIPYSHSEGSDLVMFDIELEPNDAFLADDVVWVACVATTNEGGVDGEPPRGAIVQIPWSVAASAMD